MEVERIENCPHCAARSNANAIRLPFSADEHLSQVSVVQCVACGAKYVPTIVQTITYGIGACLATFLIHFGTFLSVAAIAFLLFFFEPWLGRSARWRMLRADILLETQEYLLRNIIALGATLLLLPIVIFLIVSQVS